MRIIIQQSKSQKRQRGLTLLEMMVATTLLVVMMLGLTAMFNQTQRAFRGGLKQVDVFEGGRAVMDMVVRDIEQSIASKSVDNWSLFAGLPSPRFLEQFSPTNDNTTLRKNYLYDVYLLNYTTRWSALGYRVLDPDNVDQTNNLTFGSLYRFLAGFDDFRVQPNYYFNTLFNDRPSSITNFYLMRVADGIVHFKVKFYDASGTLIPAYALEDDPPRNVKAGDLTNNIPPLKVRPAANNNIYAWAGLVVSPEIFPEERSISFSDVSLPAMIEVELGILEPRTLEQAKSIPNTGPEPTLRTQYLQKQAGKVHVFRQQIPIRNALR